MVRSMWADRFGLPPEVLSGLAFLRRGRMIWAFSGQPPDLPCETVGLRIMSLRESPWKPTTNALQLWGRQATRNAIHLEEEETRRYVAGETQELKAEVEDGYVVVLYQGEVLGCGLYARGRLISQLPKERRMDEGGQEECGCDMG
ncbi:MAG: hypothetical protein GKC10_09795 [Methanosarcinales archaeon]|nr:hypothetical protein [Methanosarcinales archaeon]